ncbi:hypothetical protein ABT093_09565 [Kitasatospora sp. NPDC002551]|uniref:hypothetical protein n=1 Tax=Kitasatospora sp. NPDC002551 TaxID=3154539 RepID=UPI00332F3525
MSYDPDDDGPSGFFDLRNNPEWRAAVRGVSELYGIPATTPADDSPGSPMPRSPRLAE